MSMEFDPQFRQNIEEVVHHEYHFNQAREANFSRDLQCTPTAADLNALVMPRAAAELPAAEAAAPERGPQPEIAARKVLGQQDETESGGGLWCWISTAYRRHLGSSALGLACAGFSFVVGTAFASVLDIAGMPKGIGTGLVQAVCVLAYWIPFVGVTGRREYLQAQRCGGELEFSWSVKYREYAVLFALSELWFSPVKLGLMAVLVHKFGAGLMQAQIGAFFTLNSIYLGGLPMLKQGLEQIFSGANAMTADSKIGESKDIMEAGTGTAEKAGR